MNKPRKPVFILISLAGVFFFALIVFLLSLTLSPILRQTGLKAQENASRWHDQEKKISQETALAEQWQNAGNELQDFQKNYLYRDDEFTSFRRYIVKLLQQNSLHMTKMDFKNTLLDQTVERITFNLTVRGSYHDCKSFFQAIETINKMVFFSQLVFLAEEGETSVQCQLEVHFAR